MAFAPDELLAHVDALHRYALGVTHDPHLAADIVQDTVVRALERADQYRGDAPLEHWLIRIAHNLVVDRARRSEREISVDQVEDEWRDQLSKLRDPDSVIDPELEHRLRGIVAGG